MKIANVVSVFEEFNQQKIRYVVLRWFDEVPTTLQDESAYNKDIDILIDSNDIRQIAYIASQNPGIIKCDLYSITGAVGTAYKGMPYYPPILAQCILNDREMHRGGFYVPKPLTHFYSLCFHLVYHKGLESGIPTGCDIDCVQNPKRPFSKLLEDIGDKLGVHLNKPYTLFGLSEFLKKNNWYMPPDLLERWPKQTLWHEFLLTHQRSQVANWAKKLNNLIVFFIRDDAIENHQIKQILNLLEEVFEILRVERLTKDQIDNVSRNVRGGNWIEHRKTIFVGPAIAIICYDHNPQSIQDPEMARKYPFVKNRNVFRKHEIRKILNTEKHLPKKLYALHGSDNGYESQHMLWTIYGQNLEKQNNIFHQMISF